MFKHTHGMEEDGKQVRVSITYDGDKVTIVKEVDNDVETTLTMSATQEKVLLELMTFAHMTGLVGREQSQQ